MFRVKGLGLATKTAIVLLVQAPKLGHTASKALMQHGPTRTPTVCRISVFGLCLGILDYHSTSFWGNPQP